MAVNGIIHTISDNHAIKEAVISFGIMPQIIDPSSYKELLDDGGKLSGLYHKFEPVKLQEVRINTGLNSTTIEKIRDAGFKMISFHNGKTSDIIQGLIQNPRQSAFTFNTVNYRGWTKFRDSSLNSAKIIAEYKKLYKVKNLSLMFIDEFYFEEDKYDAKLLFNLDSKNLPRGIEDSVFVDYHFNLRRQHDGKDYLENVSVKVFDDNHRKTIRIVGNITFPINLLPFENVLSSHELIQLLDYCYDENKKMLKDILSEDISKKINL